MTPDELAVLPAPAGEVEPGAASAPSAPERDSRRRLEGHGPEEAEPDGPHVRLGIVWALVSLAALLGGQVWVAVVMAPVAALAAASGLRSWQPRPVEPDPTRRTGRPLPLQPAVPAALALAGGVTLISAAGPAPAVAAAMLAAVGTMAGAVFGPRGVPGAFRRILVILMPAAAASGLVLSRAQGLPPGLALAGMAFAYDSAAYLVGTGAANAWEGPIAGLASILALTVFVAAVLDPPFQGASPWVLGGLAAVLAPLGPMVGRRLTGDPEARVPALRRLDSLLLLGPAWAIGAALLLH